MADAEKTYERVVSLLEAWEPTFRSYTVAEERMQVYLDRSLNPDPIDGPSHADIRRPMRPTACDLVIGGDVGINIYREFNRREFSEFRALLDDCEQEYVVMYAYDLPIDDGSRDQWRWTESRYGGRFGDVRDVSFVHFLPGRGPERSVFEELLEYPEAILFGALSFVVGVALLVGSLGGTGHSIIGGPIVTGVTSLVLVVSLVLLWALDRDEDE